MKFEDSWIGVVVIVILAIICIPIFLPIGLAFLALTVALAIPLLVLFVICKILDFIFDIFVVLYKWHIKKKVRVPGKIYPKRGWGGTNSAFFAIFFIFEVLDCLSGPDKDEPTWKDIEPRDKITFKKYCY